jgi:hypothetical protein
MNGHPRATDVLVIVTTMILTGWVALGPPRSNESESAPLDVVQWLKALEVECDPATLGNDYEWSQSTQPTERRRMELLKKLQAQPRETAGRDFPTLFESCIE